MPINFNNITNNNTPTKHTGEPKNITAIDASNKKNTQLSGAATLSPDSINLTDSATRIKALEEQVARLPIVDTKKIEQIQNSINDGTYEINPERIAEKMIRFEKDLLSKQP